MNTLETCESQHAAVSQFFDTLADQCERLPQTIENSQIEDTEALV
jgi:hypothetical protein